MANKLKQTKSEEKQTAAETWRKPLQVPPRANAMRSFYRGTEEEETAGSASKIVPEKQPKAAVTKIEKPDKVETVTAPQPSPKKQSREAVTAKPQYEQSPPNEKSAAASDSSAATTATTAKTIDAANELTKRELSENLGIEIEDLFDVHELLRGKSFDIYQTLMKSKDEARRCKITQPELMKRTGIKNRRTFYKHEEWLIKLKLLEKRHLPGDHKGVVYRVSEISDVLPLSNELLTKFKRRLENVE